MKLRALGPGSTIAMVSPASPLDADRLDFVTDLLHAQGYQTRVMPSALKRADYLAGSDEERAADFQVAFSDDSIDAVLCTRGGYGCARLFPFLDLDAIAASRKMLLGFSDITTLHLALNRRGMPSVHAPMALTLSYPRPPYVIESFLRVLRNDLRLPEDAPAGETLVGGSVEAEVIGGCMCLLTDSIGTPEGLDTEGKILLLEDVDENPHRIDAMLTHLLNSGAAESAAGFLIGEMTRTDERADPSIGARPWREIITERLAPLGKPTIVNFPLGHAPNMLTLPMGIRARMDADSGTLEYTETLCE